jgi:hypothetical protein
VADAVEKDVVTLDITVDDVLAVQMSQSLTGLCEKRSVIASKTAIISDVPRHKWSRFGVPK